MKVRYNKIVKEDFVENILGVGKLNGGGYYFQHMHDGKIHYHDLASKKVIKNPSLAAATTTSTKAP